MLGDRFNAQDKTSDLVLNVVFNGDGSNSTGLGLISKDKALIMMKK